MDDRLPLVWFYAKTRYLRSYKPKGLAMSEATTQTALPGNWLVEDLNILLENINLQIEEVKKEAQKMDIPAHIMRTTDGDWTLRSLLVGKASVVTTLAHLQAMENLGQETFVQQNFYSPSAQG